MLVEGDVTLIRMVGHVGGRWAERSALPRRFSTTPHHHRQTDPKKPITCRETPAAGHERRGRREGELADEDRVLRPPSPSSTTTSPIAAGATVCLAVVDVKDKANPSLRPAGLGATVRRRARQRVAAAQPDLLMVVDETVLDNQEDGFKPIWMFDNQVQVTRFSISPSLPPSNRVTSKSRSFRAAQRPPEPARKLRQRGADLRDLPERRPARVRHQRRIPPR